MLEGVVGWIYDGKITSTYYNGTIEAVAKYGVGAIAGSVDSDDNIVNLVQYCYYSTKDLKAVGNGTPYANVTFLSLDEMKNKDNFKGFDFEINWNMGNKEYPYPVLTNSFYKFSNPLYADNVDNSVSARKLIRKKRILFQVLNMHLCSR